MVLSEIGQYSFRKCGEAEGGINTVVVIKSGAVIDMTTVEKTTRNPDAKNRIRKSSLVSLLKNKIADSN